MADLRREAGQRYARQVRTAGCKTGRMQDRREVGMEGGQVRCRTGGMQDMKDAGQEGCRTGGYLEWRDR